MSTNLTAEQIAEGLSDDARALLPYMSDGDMVYPLAQITSDMEVPLPLTRARKAVREMRQSGLAKHGPLYDEDEPYVRGSGSWLTGLGRQVRNILLKETP